MSFTDDDKQWLLTQFDRVEARFVVGLEQLETRFDAKLEQLETRFDAKLEQLETRFVARLERVETSLLTEFHKWASPVEMRQRSHAAALKALDAEMEFMQDRVTKLEGK